LDAHKSFKKEELVPKLSINLKPYKDQKEKEKALNDFIMERAKESMEHYDKFNSIIKDICYKNDGFRFKSGVKIRDVKQKSALLRIKEKMLSNIYQQKLEEKLKQSKTKKSGTKESIAETVRSELIKYEENMNSIFLTHEKPIDFKVSDMLRGKCMFMDVSKINKCCSDILNMISKDGSIKLIEIDNRLRKGTSDLTLKLLFGSVVAELQLVINLKAAEYEFSHKIYELVRSKFFSPICQLSTLNETIARDYILELDDVVTLNRGKNK